MADDVHRSFVAECHEKLDDLETGELADLRGEASSARGRAEASGDPLEVVPLYDALLAAMDQRLAAFERDQLLASLDTEGLRTLLREAEVPMRVEALRRASELALPGAEEAILSHLEDEADRFVVATAVKALGGVGTADAVGPLRRYLRHEDPRVRANAVEGLTELGAPPEELLRCVEDVDHRVRANAAFGLLDARPEEARRVLRGLLRDPAEAARKAATEVLERIDPDRFLEAYLDALDVAPPDAAGILLRTAARCHDPRVVRFVLDVVEDESRPFPVRSQAMQVARELAERCEDDTWSEALLEASQDFLRQMTADDGPPPGSMEALKDPERPGAPPPAPEPGGADAASPGKTRLTGAEQMRERVKKWVTVIGKVMDSATRKPVRRATVRVASSGVQEVTDRKGQFSIPRLERGETYVFVVEKQGYPTRSHRHRCSGMKEQIVRILLVGKRV